MVDRLRLFWNRPLRDADRPRLFAIAVALIVAAAVVLTQLERPASPPPAAAPVSQPAIAAPAEAVVTPAPSAPGEEGTRTPVAASRADVAASKRAARRFLAGYLPYSYGRRRPRRIQSATLALRRRLVAQRPRIPVRERRRTARLALLQSNAVGARRAELLALVEDGRRRYSVALELVRTAAGWRVARVGS